MRWRASMWIYTVMLVSGCGSAAAGEIARAAIATGVAIVAAAAYHAASGECWAQCSNGYVCDRRRGVCVTAVDRDGTPITFTYVDPDQFCIEEEDGSVVCPDDPATNYGQGPAPASSSTPGTAPGRAKTPSGATDSCNGVCYATERCRVIDGMAYCVTDNDPLYEDEEDDEKTPASNDDGD